NTKMPVLITSLIFIFGCAKNKSELLVPDDNESQTVSCKLEGTFSRCTNNGTSSTRVTLSVISSHLQETVSNFNNVTDCSGAPIESFNLSADLILGETGASSSFEGATDVDLTPDQDIFRCGAGKAAYTFIKFTEEDCNHFQIPITTPSCDIDARGTTLDVLPFTRQ
ncbi:MAG: hypothetical protein AB7H97_11450, partial [Pseudobdellovibrionaceae bacterium]